MATVEIYTIPTCPYCHAAKALLKRKGVAYQETDVSRDPQIRVAMTQRAGGRHTVPQIFIDVDRDQVLKQGVAISDVYKTLQSFLGSGFINYFNRFGRQWQVYVQAEGDYRTNIENIGQFYVRNAKGNPVPLSALTSIRRISGPEFTMRYNLYRSAQINASGAPGVSSAQVMKALEEVFAETMPSEMGYDYMGMSFQEQRAQQGISPMVIFATRPLECTSTPGWLPHRSGSLLKSQLTPVG